MYATLNMLKLLDACNAGYTRVLKAVGGPSHGKDTPIPLWMGATTTDGLEDVDWIAERGMIIVDEQFNVMYPRAFPYLLRYLSFLARQNYCDAMVSLLQIEMHRPNNALVHQFKAAIDTLVDAHLKPEAEVREVAKFLGTFPMESGISSNIRNIRTMAMAVFPEYGRNLLATCQQLGKAARLPIIKDDGGDMLDRPFAEILTAALAKAKEEREQQEKREAMSRSKRRVVQSRDEDDIDASETPEDKKAFEKRAEKLQAQIDLLNFCDDWNRRKRLGIQGNFRSPLNKDCIKLFLSWFDQSDYFARRKVRHEKAWDGVTVNVDALKLDTAVLVHRDAEGRILHAAFIVKDPAIISVAAGMLAKAQHAIKEGNLGINNINDADGEDADEDENDRDFEEDEEVDDEMEDA